MMGDALGSDRGRLLEVAIDGGVLTLEFERGVCEQQLLPVDDSCETLEFYREIGKDADMRNDGDAQR